MMMGSADTVPTAPAQAVGFVEDLPEADQAKAAMARALALHLPRGPGGC